MKKTKFHTTENPNKYVNFIFDNCLEDDLTLFETGYTDGNFFIDIEGEEDLIEHIKRLSMKGMRGKYVRSQDHKLKQSKIKLNKK